MSLSSYLQFRTKYLRQTLAFMWNSALREKFNFHFYGVLCWCWQKFSFWTGHYAIILWHFEIFLIFPNFLRSLVLSNSETREATRNTMFIANNHTWLKRKFGKASKSLKILWPGLKLACNEFNQCFWINV